MSEAFQILSPADAPEISGSRRFDAPRDLVFDAFTSASHLANWWGPTGFTLTTHELTFAPGGVWRFVMHGPDGRDYQNKIVFVEIERPERIVYRHPGDGDAEPVSMETTIVFVDEGGKTRLNWRMRFQTLAERDRVEREYGAAQGLAQTLARLFAYTAESQKGAFRISRSFDADAARLWTALTEPERMAKWFGPKGLPVIAAKMDFRPGGSYHYGLQTPDGRAMWGRFAYREIEAPSRIVLISSFSDAEGGLTRHPLTASWPLETLSVFELERQEGRTQLTIWGLPIHATDAERATFAGATASLHQGWSGTFDQLADYLAAS